MNLQQNFYVLNEAGNLLTLERQQLVLQEQEMKEKMEMIQFSSNQKLKVAELIETKLKAKVEQLEKELSNREQIIGTMEEALMRTPVCKDKYGAKQLTKTEEMRELLRIENEAHLTPLSEFKSIAAQMNLSDSLISPACNFHNRDTPSRRIICLRLENISPLKSSPNPKDVYVSLTGFRDSDSKYSNNVKKDLISKLEHLGAK